MYSPHWSAESKKRFIALLPELQALVTGETGSTSQEKFGNFFGVRGSTVQSWQQGSIPETPKLEKVATVLRWSLDELVYYLRTGERPCDKSSELSKLVYKLETLPLQDVAFLVQAGMNRITGELQKKT